MTDILIWILILVYFLQLFYFIRSAKQFKRMSRLFKQAMDDQAILSSSASPELPKENANES